MTLNRRSIIKGAAGTAAASALALNAKRSTAYAVPNIVHQTGSNVDISFWYGFTGPLGEQTEALIERFNAQGNGITVTGTAQATYEETTQLLTIALQDGSNPDIALLSDTSWFRFYLAQAMLPLDALIASTGFNVDDLVDSFRYEGVRTGQLYWLPFARSTPLIYYNTDMFSAIGLDAFPATWSEFEAIAPQLVDGDAQVGGLALGSATSYIPWPFQGIVWAYGGGYSDPDFTVRINEPGAVAAGNLLLRGVRDGWAYVSAASNNFLDDFTNGYAAVTLASTGGLTGITTAAQANGINFATAFLPGEVPNAGPHCSTGGAGFGIMANIPAERQEAAFEFLRFCASYDEAVTWSQNTGYMPILKSAIAGPEMAEFFAANPNFQTAVDQLPQTRAQDSVRAFLPGGNELLGTGITEIITNQTDPQEAFDALAELLTAEAAPIIEQVIALEGDLTSGAATPPAATPGATPAATPVA